MALKTQKWPKLNSLTKMFRLTAFFWLPLAVASSGINYCGSKMCGYSDSHTLCQYVTKSPSCVGYVDGGLSSAEKARVLARLNSRRNDVASGRLPGMPSAGNMLKLRWVEELAKEAQLWADQCRPPRAPEEHDTCRDLYSITVGQCVASVVGEAPGMKIESMVDIWFMQSKYYKENVTYYVPSNYDKHYYGDFAQMLWSRAFVVGCGRARFLLTINGRARSVERLVCNFGPRGPAPFSDLWRVAAPAAECPARSRPCRYLASLCDYQNEINQPNDIDQSMSIEDHILLNAVLEIEKNETIFQGSLDEIYLTYLAMITLESPEIVTLSHMQKRDIIEDTNLDDGIENTNQKVTESNEKNYKQLNDPNGMNEKNNDDITKFTIRRNNEFNYDYRSYGLGANESTTTADTTKTNYIQAETTIAIIAVLNQMENEEANIASARKMRRDIEDNTEENLSKLIYTTLYNGEVPKDVPQDLNATVETPAILNMVMKYMPYLKNYENNILRNSVDYSMFDPLLILSSVLLVL